MIRRIGEVCAITPEGFEKYAQYHANPWPEVDAMLKACHIQNYTIFHRNGLLFAYYEYTGEDFDADMAKMAADPATQRWWDVVKPLMSPLKDRKPGEFWAGMEPVYHLD